MANPVPGYSVQTGFGKRGSYWSCDKKNGKGIHTGVDIPAPKGTPIVAPIAGQIRHRNYGSAFGPYQFAISPDKDQPFGEGEVFFAHCSSRLPDGTRVEVGQEISKVDKLGNATGYHLHMEYMPETKNQWRCGVHANPAPILEHMAGSGGGGGSPAKHKYTSHIYTDKLGVGEPSNGDSSSDTVKELQFLLDKAGFSCSEDVSGVYGPATDKAVRGWQKKIGNKPDAEMRSYLGKKQVAKLFSKSVYTIHDKGLPKIAQSSSSSDSGSATPAPTGSLAADLRAAGFEIDDSNVPYGRSSTWDRPKFILMHHTASAASASPASVAAYVRTGGDSPPLSQFVVDNDGKVWLCSKARSGQAEPGRASHAGKGTWPGVPRDRMNEVSVGIEFQHPGDKPILGIQYDRGVKFMAFLCKRYGIFTRDKNGKITVPNVIGHKEWSSSGKVDPCNDMDVVRADVAKALEALEGSAGPSEPPVDPPSEPPKPSDPSDPSEPDGANKCPCHNGQRSRVALNDDLGA